MNKTRFILAPGLALLLIAGTPIPTFSREAGWVPIETSKGPNVSQSDGAVKKAPSGKKVNKRKSSRKATLHVGTVYENQPPVTEKEVYAFVELLPRFRAWTRKSGEEAHPVVNKEGKPDFLYSNNAAKWVEDHDFEAPRFFCIMGKMAAGVVIVEEGNDFKGTRPADMPSVSAQELTLVRKHLGALLTAGGPVSPIK